MQYISSVKRVAFVALSLIAIAQPVSAEFDLVGMLSGLQTELKDLRGQAVDLYTKKAEKKKFGGFYAKTCVQITSSSPLVNAILAQDVAKVRSILKTQGGVKETDRLSWIAEDGFSYEEPAISVATRQMRGLNSASLEAVFARLDERNTTSGVWAALTPLFLSGSEASSPTTQLALTAVAQSKFSFQDLLADQIPAATGDLWDDTIAVSGMLGGLGVGMLMASSEKEGEESKEASPLQIPSLPPFFDKAANHDGMSKLYLNAIQPLLSLMNMAPDLMQPAATIAWMLLEGTPAGQIPVVREFGVDGQTLKNYWVAHDLLSESKMFGPVFSRLMAKIPDSDLVKNLEQTVTVTAADTIPLTVAAWYPIYAVLASSADYDSTWTRPSYVPSKDFAIKSVVGETTIEGGACAVAYMQNNEAAYKALAHAKWATAVKATDKKGKKVGLADFASRQGAYRVAVAELEKSLEAAENAGEPPLPSSFTMRAAFATANTKLVMLHVEMEDEEMGLPLPFPTELDETPLLTWICEQNPAQMSVDFLRYLKKMKVDLNPDSTPAPIVLLAAAGNDAAVEYLRAYQTKNPLVLAVEADNLPAFQRLLKLSPKWEVDLNQDTLFETLSKEDDVAKFRLYTSAMTEEQFTSFINEGFFYGKSSAKDPEFWTPLQVTIFQGKTQIALYLINTEHEKIDFEAQFSNTETALTRAISENNSAVVRALLHKGAVLPDADALKGYYNNKDVSDTIKLLLKQAEAFKKWGAEIEAKNKEG